MSEPRTVREFVEKYHSALTNAVDSGSMGAAMVLTQEKDFAQALVEWVRDEWKKSCNGGCQCDTCREEFFTRLLSKPEGK